MVLTRYVKKLSFGEKVSVILLIGFLVVSIVVCLVWPTDTVSNYYTQSILNYNTEEYPLGSLFLEEIPLSAEVISFSNYYFHLFTENRDVYLELKFDTEEDLRNYITAVEDHIVSEKGWKSLDGKRVSLANPYNSKYIDVFYDIAGLAKIGNIDEHFSYYEFAFDSEGKLNRVDGAYDVLSYSLDELIVILTSNCGSYYANDGYTPKYMSRFDVPETEASKRYIWFE